MQTCLRYTKMVLPYVPVIPLSGLPTETGTLRPNMMAPWEEAGIVTDGDLFNGGELIEFPTLMEQWGMAAGQFLTHCKIL